MLTRVRLIVPVMLSAVAVACSVASPARAAFIVNIVQDGSDVVATGSGSLNLAGLAYDGTSDSLPARVQASFGSLALGFSNPLDAYTGFTGPNSFGSGATVAASSASGLRVSMQGASGVLYLPGGYTSGTALSDSAVFNGQTFLSLGLATGTYVWSWNSAPGVVSDQYILNIGVVPEPSSLSVLLLGVTAVTAVSLTRKKTFASGAGDPLA